MSDLTVPKLQSILPEVERTGQASGRTPSSSFSDFVKRSLADVSRQVNHADQAVGDLATGKNQDIHNTMIAMQ